MTTDSYHITCNIYVMDWIIILIIIIIIVIIMYV